MGRNCCVLGCPSGVRLPFHSFPKDVIMAHKWKKAIYSEKIKDLTDEQIRKCVVCYKHFADSDYESVYRLRRLKPGVIPSLFIPDNGNNIDNLKAELIMENPEAEISRIPTITTTKVSKTEISPVSSITTSKVNKTENNQFVSHISEVTSTLANGETKLSSLENSTNLYKHIKYFHHFTPKMWKLYRIACILKRKQEAISKRQLSFRQRIRQAKHYSKSPRIEKLLCSLTPTQRTFIEVQIKATKYLPKVCT